MKIFSETMFTINENLTVECRSEDTRSGFRHIAELWRDGQYIEEVKATYLNRTWESYEFQSVLYKLAEKAKTLSKQEKQLLNDFAKDGKNAPDSGLSAIGAVMALGDLFSNSQKESNDWKKRMLEAGLGGRGLIMPDDWDTLSEDEKTRRLNGAAEMLTQK